MTRKTNLIQGDGDTFNHSRAVAPERWAAFDAKMDTFWNWIEGMPVTDEMWKVEANGDMTLEVDEKTLIEILSDDSNKAYEDFDAYEEHSPEAAAWEWHDLPYDLMGTYIIKGVYDANQRLVDGERTYFFIQGA